MFASRMSTSCAGGLRECDPPSSLQRTASPSPHCSGSVDPVEAAPSPRPLSVNYISSTMVKPISPVDSPSPAHPSSPSPNPSMPATSEHSDMKPESPSATLPSDQLAAQLLADQEEAGATLLNSDESDESIFVVTCGFLTGKLHYEKFKCPGIHQECIEFNTVFVSPKQFTVMAAKDKQKDWKGAIKLNGQQIRSLMERKELDFYKHEEFCSGRCVSKNNRVLTVGGEGSNGSVVGDFEYLYPLTLPNNPYTQFLQGYQPDFRQVVKSEAAHTLLKTEGSSSSSCGGGTDSDCDSGPGSGVREPTPFTPSSSSVTPAPVITTTANGIANQNALLLAMIEQRGPYQDTSLITKDPGAFWSAVTQLDLFPELIGEISHEASRLLNPSLPASKVLDVADKLSQIVDILGIHDRLYQRLHTKRCLTKAQAAMLNSEIEDLRRRKEEQLRRQREMKRKSELLDQLIGISEAKRACLLANVVAAADRQQQNFPPSPDDDQSQSFSSSFC